MRSLWPTPLPRPVLLALGLATALWLSGCASVIRLENDVQSYPHWTATERPVAATASASSACLLSATTGPSKRSSKPGWPNGSKRPAWRPCPRTAPPAGWLK